MKIEREFTIWPVNETGAIAYGEIITGLRDDETVFVGAALAEHTVSGPVEPYGIVFESDLTVQEFLDLVHSFGLEDPEAVMRIYRSEGMFEALTEALAIYARRERDGAWDEEFRSELMKWMIRNLSGRYRLDDLVAIANDIIEAMENT